ncbi:MAG: pyrroline-5-carboxylate reductase [Planctomycetota bacterium]|jgi:pyrroline-5-carboxylate reductase
METIGFIGSGNMAEALIKGIIEAKIYRPANIYISDIRGERLGELAEKYGVTTIKRNSELAEKVDVLVLSVKPQNIDEVLEEIKASVKDEMLIISIAAGIRVSNISGILGDKAIVRVIPNTPALICEGASALYANERAKGKKEQAKLIFDSVGEVVLVDDEGLIDAVTAVSGSGPAYYFLMIEEMIKAAVELGIEEEAAKKLVLQTAKGAVLLAAGAESPAELRRKVTSPGGTTEAAIKVLVEEDFGGLISKAIKRACQRSKELSK